VVLDVSYIGKLDTEALEENVRIAKSIGANLSTYQKNKINEAVEDLGKLIPYMKNKIKPSESLENLVD